MARPARAGDVVDARRVDGQQVDVDGGLVMRTGGHRGSNAQLRNSTNRTSARRVPARRCQDRGGRRQRGDTEPVEKRQRCQSARQRNEADHGADAIVASEAGPSTQGECESPVGGGVAIEQTDRARQGLLPPNRVSPATTPKRTANNSVLTIPIEMKRAS